VAHLSVLVAIWYGVVCCMRQGSNRLFCSYPFLFDGQGKTQLLQVDAMVQMQVVCLLSSIIVKLHHCRHLLVLFEHFVYIMISTSFLS